MSVEWISRELAPRATARVARTRRRQGVERDRVLVRATLAVALQTAPSPFFVTLRERLWGWALRPSGSGSAIRLRSHVVVNRMGASPILTREAIQWIPGHAENGKTPHIVPREKSTSL